MRVLISATLVLLAACSDGEAKDSAGSTSFIGDATAGADVYTGTCGICHAADGSGASGPALAPFMSKSDEELSTIILDGYEDMPAQSLSGQETADVIAYLRATFGS